MKTLVKYDFISLNKSKKTVILIVLSVFFTLLSVFSSRYMTDLLGPLMEDNGISFNLPEPTLQGSYLTFSGDLYKNFTFVIIFVSLAYFMSNKIKGMMSLILSKPISCKQYILSKYLTFNGIVLAVLMITYLFTSLATYGVYNDLLIMQGLKVLLIYYVFVLLLSAAVMLASVLCKSYMVAAIASISFYLLIVALNSMSFIPVVNYLPGLTMTHASNLLIGTLDMSQLFISIGLSLILACIFVLLSIREMKHQDFSN